MAQLIPTSKEVLAAADWSPQEDIHDAMKREQAFMDTLHQRRQPNSLINAVIHFPYADSHAQYLVVKDKPLRLMHLPFGDAWQVSAATIRGLRLGDVESMVARNDAIRARIASQRAANAATAPKSEPA